MTRPYNKQQKKRTFKTMNFAVPADHRVKLQESEKKDKYDNLARELKKNAVHESDVYSNFDWHFWYSHRRINKGTGRPRNKSTSGENPNYCIVEIGQNIWKIPGNLRRLAVTQTYVKDHQLTLMWNTHKELIIIIPLWFDWIAFHFE